MEDLSTAFEIEVIKALKKIHQGTNICDENRGAWGETSFPQQPSYGKKRGQTAFFFPLGISLPRTQLTNVRGM